jgi:hypothetical protein
MRILRGLRGTVLACGCLAGVYETYDGQVVGLLDSRGPDCRNPRHRPGSRLSEPLPGDDPRPGRPGRNQVEPPARIA